MSWGAIGAAAVGVVGSAMLSDGSSGGSTSGPAQMADPFASQRPQYQSMLQQMMTGGGTPGYWQNVPSSGSMIPTYTGAQGALDFLANPDAQTKIGQTIFSGGAQQPQQQWVPGTQGTGGFTPNDPSYQWRFDQGLDAVNRTAGAQHLLGSGNRLQELMNYGQGQASTEYANQFSRLSQLAGANIGSPAAAGQLQAGYNQNVAQGAGQIGQAVVGGLGSYFGGGGSSTGMTDMTGFYQQPNYFAPQSGGTYPSGGSTYFMDPATFAGTSF